MALGNAETRRPLDQDIWEEASPAATMREVQSQKISEPCHTPTHSNTICPAPTVRQAPGQQHGTPHKTKALAPEGLPGWRPGRECEKHRPAVRLGTGENEQCLWGGVQGWLWR